MKQREALLKNKTFVAHWIEPWDGGPWPCVELVTDDVALLALPYAGTVTEPVIVCGQERRRRTVWPTQEIPWTIHIPADEDRLVTALAKLACYVGAQGKVALRIEPGADSLGARLRLQGWDGEIVVSRSRWWFDPWPQEQHPVVVDGARLGMLLSHGETEIRVPDAGMPVLILPKDGTYQALLAQRIE